MGNELSVEQKKAKHDFAMHQDRLLWSRLQNLGVVQVAILAAGYSVPERLVATVVVGLGMILTGLICVVMKRDDVLGSKAFEESGVPKTHPDWPKWLKGRYCAYFGITLLILTDLALIAHRWKLIG